MGYACSRFTGEGGRRGYERGREKARFGFVDGVWKTFAKDQKNQTEMEFWNGTMAGVNDNIGLRNYSLLFSNPYPVYK
jgi:hypothetical protein